MLLQNSLHTATISSQRCSCVIDHALPFTFTMISKGVEKSPTCEQVPATRTSVETTHTVPADIKLVSDKEINEKGSQTTANSIEDHDAPAPKLHLKTWLTVFAVCLIYFAQLINVVGAGAVRITLPIIEKSNR